MMIVVAQSIPNAMLFRFRFVFVQKDPATIRQSYRSPRENPYIFCAWIGETWSLLFARIKIQSRL